ncbi:MAG TPA: hypothetical protein VF457_03165, partial [Burkholderiaceae bacterium]
GALAVALAAVAALAWRLRQQARIAHSAWFNESQLASPPLAPETQLPPLPSAPWSQFDPHPSVGGEVVGDSVMPPVAAGFPEPGPEEVEPEAEVETPLRHEATQPLDRNALAGMMAAEAAPRELSVEELLDLEQQADFFIALGQEDAAVDLLMAHLRSAGGQSPLPYTKLLEIYKRQGDRSAYERTRARFNRRFNAYAPDWDKGPGAGRTLEDYPDTVARLQAAWHQPIDAMAILEALLFKRDETSELFELPAYRDILLLYSLARDLWTHEAGTVGTHVDVLLPLDEAPAPREINGLDLPIEHPRLPPGERGGFAATGLPGRIDLELPNLHGGSLDHGDDVHATLDTFSLAPVEPTDAPSEPGWGVDDEPPADDPPTRR